MRSFCWLALAVSVVANCTDDPLRAGLETDTSSALQLLQSKSYHVAADAGKDQYEASETKRPAKPEPISQPHSRSSQWLQRVSQLDESLIMKLMTIVPITEDRYLKLVVVLLIALVSTVMIMAALGMRWTKHEEHVACLVTPNEAKDGCFKMPLTDLINLLGIPAFAVLDFSAKGLTGLPRRLTMVLLAGQSWLLQGAALSLLLVGVRTSVLTTPLPRLAIALATYLNVLTHLSELPVALLLLRHVRDFHTESTTADCILALLICFIGGIVVPCAAIVVGGLFLCTATNYCDLFMKSVVFKFISNIDTMIVAINSRTNVVAGSVSPIMVCLPNDKSFARTLNYVLCVIPVFPAALVFLLSGLGLSLKQGSI